MPPTLSTRAYHAFDAALAGATVDGIRDCLEALQTEWFAIDSGKVELVHGKWGTAGACREAESLSACPLNALFIRQANQHRSGLARAVALATSTMGRRGYRPRDFYSLWDAKRLDLDLLRRRAEQHLEARVNGTRRPAPASDD